MILFTQMIQHLRKKDSLIIAFIAVIVIYFLLAKLFAIFNYHYIMDEFCDLSIASELFRGALPFKEIAFHPRPFVFNYILTFPFYFTEDSLWILWFNRFLFFIINLGILFSIYKITFYYTREPVRSWFAVLLAVTAIPFIFNGCRIRCDLINSFLYLLVYWSLLTRWDELKASITEGIILGLSFLVSPKAVYYILFYFIFLATIFIFEKPRMFTVKRFASATISLLGVSIFYVSFVFLIDAWPEFYRDNIERAFQVGILSDTYNSFFYLRKFALQNIVSIVLFFFALFSMLFKWKTSLIKRHDILMCINVLGLLAIIFLHKAKFPYFFLLIIPLLASFTAIHLPMHLKKGLLHIFFVTIVSVSAYPIYLSERIWWKSAAYQNEIIRACESYLLPSETYFDGIGMVFMREKAAHFDMTVRNITEYYHGSYPRIVPQLIDKQCKLIIDNYRMKKLSGIEREFILNNYVPIPQNPHHILIPGKVLRPEHNEFEISIEGPYQIIDTGNSRLLIDDKPVITSVHLFKGKHKYSIGGQQKIVTLIYSSFNRYKGQFYHARPEIYLKYIW